MLFRIKNQTLHEPAAVTDEMQQISHYVPPIPPPSRALASLSGSRIAEELSAIRFALVQLTTLLQQPLHFNPEHEVSITSVAVCNSGTGLQDRVLLVL